MADQVNELRAALSRRPAADLAEWRPRLYVPERHAEREALMRLVAGDEVRWLHDAIDAQLGELVETRHADRKLDAATLAREVERFLDGRPRELYGTWVFYPWAGRLVHTLPEAEYRELRTSRNRNKITVEEQARLRALTVGVAGLSVGQATAVTLALEEVGGAFRLADFDTLNLSNMNRLRAGVHEIGLNKAVLTAREIFEINPYANVAVFTDGIREHTLDAFLVGDKKLDLLFEECDDLAMKVRLRERARDHRIAVLMETSDRGLFDVERFDKEPQRPLFHGLTGPLAARDLAAMTTYEKVPVVLKIIGAATMSPRMAASLVDIDATLKTWPQLASAVALGGAINTDAARRVALGTLNESGRYYVDLAGIIRDGAAEIGAAPSSADDDDDDEFGQFDSAPATQVGAPLIRVRGSVTADVVRAIVGQGVLAPSGGNCQPWRFAFRDGRLRCFHDVERSRSFLDLDHRAAHLSFGAAIENMRLAAAEIGLDTVVELHPVAGDATAVCDLTFSPSAVAEDALSRQIAARVTNRRLGERAPLPPGTLSRLADVAAAAGARLTFIESPEAMDAAGKLLGRGDRLRYLSPVMHREMMNEVRWTPTDVRATRDGLDLLTLELNPTDLAGLRLLSSWPVLQALGEVGGGAGLEKPARKSVAAASALGLITVDESRPAAWLRAGRALERVWLSATAAGLALQPMTALIYLFARLERGGDGLSPRERDELGRLRAIYEQLFAPPPGACALMLFRIGRAAPPSARSLRRAVDDVLTFDTEGR